MVLLVFLLVTEILMLIVLKQHFFAGSKPKYYIAFIIHILLSLWVWIVFIENSLQKGHYDDPKHVWLMMCLTGLVVAVVIPRFIVSVLHFTGKMIRMNKGGHIRWLTDTGLILMLLIILVIARGTRHGRFDFKTEEVTLKIKNLDADLEGLRIVQISDLHLISFYHHRKQLEEVIDSINRLHPDIIVNTGDFVSFGWREFERNDTILAKSRSRYGNFAILGNHDVGTYDPEFTASDREENIRKMEELITASGYKVLNDESAILRIGNSRLAISGVTTGGRHPHMTHGNINDAIAGSDSANVKILLLHDPNAWEESVAGKTDINVTLSGHTHGMQMGIITKNFRWSPAKYFYPHWNGLYISGEQLQYVNRGLGVLSIPFRICMPPEITVLTLKKD